MTHDVLAVVSQSGPTVSFFDTETHELLGRLELPSEPHELCFDPARRLLWCAITYRRGYYHANEGAQSLLAVIDPDRRALVDVVDIAPEAAPHGLAVHEDRLYVSVEGRAGVDGGVVVVDLDSRKPLDRIDTGARGPHWFVVDPAGRRGYASNKEAPFVSVVDLERGQLAGRVPVPGSEGLAVSADGGELYVAAPYIDLTTPPTAAPGIRVIDTVTAGVVATLPTDDVVFPVHLTSTGRLLAGELRRAPAGTPGAGPALAPTTGPIPAPDRPGRLHVFDPATRTRTGTAELTGIVPLTITSSPDGRRAYVSGVRSSTVDIVDLDTLSLVGSLDIPRHHDTGAHGLAHIPGA